MNIIRFAFILILAQSVTAQQNGTAFVEGIVTTVGDNQPLPKAAVELRSIDSGAARIFTTVTPNDGKFSFSNVPPGLYQITAIRGGYVRGDYGKHGPGASGVRLDLAANERMTGVRLVMSDTGAIAGRVTDSRGEPVGNVHMKALRFAYQEGHRVLVNVKSVFSNDLGEYRLGWLTPGLYKVMAVHPDGSAIPLNQPEILNSSTAGAATVVTNPGGFNGGSFSESGTKDPAIRARVDLAAGDEYIPVYYPTTYDERSATVLDVRAGAEIVGANIVVAPTRTGSITGTVIDGAAREPWKTQPTLQVVRIPSYNLRTTAVAVDGNRSFSIRNLAPGSYALIVRLADGDRVTTTTTVEILEGEAENVQLTLYPAMNVSARVFLEGFPDTTVLKDLSVNLVTSPMIPGIANTPAAKPSDDGVLTLTGVSPGEYIVNVSPIMNGAATTLRIPSLVVPGPGTAEAQAPPPRPAGLENAYVKSIRLGSTDVLNGTLRIDGTPPSVPLEIVIATDAGQIQGAALDANQSPMPNATVVLVPDVAYRRRIDLYKSVAADKAGRWSFQNVPPGNYKVFAWEDIETGSWLDEQFIQSVEAFGKPAPVTPGARLQGNVVVIPYR